MKYLHNHQGYNMTQSLWADFGNLSTLSVFTTTIISFLYSLYLWYSLKHTPIINSYSNIHTIYDRLLIIIKNHIWKILGANLFGTLVIMIILLTFVDKFRSVYLSFAYILGSLLISLIALFSSNIIASTSVKVVYESEKYTLNQRDERLSVAKKGSSLISCFTMSLVLLVMFLLNLSYNYLAHSLVRRQVLQCMISFAFGGISTALFISSIGGILSKGFDIGSDTFGKIQHNLQQDHARNIGSLYDAAGDVLGKGMGESCRRTAEFLAVIAGAMIIIHFETKSIDGTSIIWEFISLPYLVASIAVITQVIISFIINGSQSSYIGIKGIQLGSLIILVLFFLLSLKNRKPFVSSGHHVVISDFIKVLITLASGLIIGTLIALQSQLFSSPKCRFFKQVYESTTTGASTNIIQGLATGYLVTLLPTILIALIIFFVYYYLNSFGIALAALGMGSILPIVLNVVNINTILDCALCISKLTTLNNQSLFLRPDFQESRFEQYYVKMFSISINLLSAVSLFLFFLFIVPSLANNYAVQFAGLLIGSMFPYIILSINLRSSASIACSFVAILKLIRSSLDQQVYLLSVWQLGLFTISCLMIVIVPIIIFKIFGIVVFKGFIAGCLISGFQIAISSLSSGTILAIVNQRIQRQHLTRSLRPQNEQQIMWKGGTIGDTVGDPLKDIGEPVINLFISSIIMISILVGVDYHMFPSI